MILAMRKLSHKDILTIMLARDRTFSFWIYLKRNVETQSEKCSAKKIDCWHLRGNCLFRRKLLNGMTRRLKIIHIQRAYVIPVWLWARLIQFNERISSGFVFSQCKFNYDILDILQITKPETEMHVKRK